MLKPNVPLNFFLIIVLKCSFIYGQGSCPPNEVPSECEDTCNTCDPDIVCPAVCTPGCQCLPGYSRDFDNFCIPRQFCTGFDMLPSDSSLEEIPTGRGLLANRGGCPSAQLCTVSCRRRGFKSGACLGPGREYCNCYSNLSGGNPNPPVPDPTKNTRCPNLGQCPPSGGIVPRYLHGPPPPPVAPYPPALPIPPRLPLVPKPLYPPVLPPKLPLVPKPLYPPVLPPKLPFVPKPPYVPGLPIPPKLPVIPPKPPVVKPPLVPPPPPNPAAGVCPNVAKCIIKCQSKGSSSGFCTGIQRRACQCF